MFPFAKEWQTPHRISEMDRLIGFLHEGTMRKKDKRRRCNFIMNRYGWLAALNFDLRCGEESETGKMTL